MHSTWAVPTWREGGILHPVQVAKEGRTGGDGGSWGTGREMMGTVWTIDIHKEKKGRGIRQPAPVYMSASSPRLRPCDLCTQLERPPGTWECGGPGVKV